MPNLKNMRDYDKDGKECDRVIEVQTVDVPMSAHSSIIFRVLGTGFGRPVDPDE